MAFSEVTLHLAIPELKAFWQQSGRQRWLQYKYSAVQLDQGTRLDMHKEDYLAVSPAKRCKEDVSLPLSIRSQAGVARVPRPAPEFDA